MPQTVTFQVKVVTEPDEVVGVVGNCSKLGKWNHEKAVMMEKNLKKKKSHLWSKDIELDGVEKVEYRFFVGSFLENDPNLKLTIVKWESHDNPRSFKLNGNFKLRTAIFGIHEGVNRVAKGWLVGQTCIQLRVHGKPIKMWKKRYEDQNYCIKCVPMDYRPLSVAKYGCQEDVNVNTLISVLDEKNAVPCEQDSYGRVFRDGNYFVFKVESYHPAHLGFRFEFFVHEPDLPPYAVPKFIGFANLLPLQQNLSLHLGLRLPLMGLKHKPIGELLVDSLIVKPHPSFRGLMDKTYRSHWRMQGKTLDVGHRGMGMGHKNIALVRENTLSSFSAAASHGADMIEFDVMLTCDHIPVIFHNYTVCLSLSDSKSDQSALFSIPIKDLTLSNLRSVKLSLSLTSLTYSVSDLPDEQNREPFPTLKRVLINIDKNLYFNIEVKHPLIIASGLSEQEHYFDHNLQVDIILETVFQFAGERQIVFSSFDADTCIMLQLKQNLYPVLFLSNGPTVRYKPYRDFRAKTFEAAISFALSEAILGVDFEAEGVLQDLSLIKKAHDAGLIIFIWGEDANSPKTIQLLRHHGADGIIYDRIDFNKPHESGVFSMSPRGSVDIRNGNDDQETENICRIINP